MCVLLGTMFDAMVTDATMPFNMAWLQSPYGNNPIAGRDGGSGLGAGDSGYGHSLGKRFYSRYAMLPKQQLAMSKRFYTGRMYHLMRQQLHQQQQQQKRFFSGGRYFHFMQHQQNGGQPSGEYITQKRFGSPWDYAFQ